MRDTARLRFDGEQATHLLSKHVVHTRWWNLGNVLLLQLLQVLLGLGQSVGAISWEGLLANNQETINVAMERRREVLLGHANPFHARHGACGTHWNV